jgi:hypothetical protein
VRLLTILVVLVLALGGAACGGDDEASGDTDTVRLETTDDTTTDETTTDEATDDETTTGEVGDSLESEECQELISASTALGEAFSAAGNGGDLEESSAGFSEYADQAPEEIRGDLQIMAQAYADYIDAINEIGIEPGEPPSADQLQEFRQALASISTAEVSAVSQRFTTWAAANC